MSVQAISWVLQHSESEGKTRCVLFAIANQVGGDGSGWAYVNQIMRDARCSLDTYKRAIAWAEEHGEVERGINKGEAVKAAPNRKPNRFCFPLMGGANVGGEDCTRQQDAAPQPAPPDPSLVLDPKLSSSSVFQTPRHDSDERVESILRLFAERQTRKHADRNPAGFRLKTLQNARSDYSELVADWITRYDVSDGQVADALVGGACVPASWGMSRRETA